jgi:pimeloyl-ACP methyl ester carboxylesterase
MPNITANGISLHYESIGRDSDPAIVLIMGLSVQMIMWHEDFCEMLASRGFRVIRFDNRDVGLSTHMTNLAKPNIVLEYMKFMMQMKVNAPYTLDDMAADTAGLIDALNLGRAHLVGASMGGMIAQNLAATLPDRVASLTSIMSTTGRRSLPKASWRATKAILTPKAKRGDTEGAIKRMMYVLRTITSRTYPIDETRLRELCERHIKRANNPEGGMRQLVAIAAADDRTRIVRQIKVPTLVLHGAEDELIRPAAGYETAHAIREGGGTARMVEIEGMGHDFPEPLWPRIVDEIAGHVRTHERG